MTQKTRFILLIILTYLLSACTPTPPPSFIKTKLASGKPEKQNGNLIGAGVSFEKLPNISQADKEYGRGAEDSIPNLCTINYEQDESCNLSTLPNTSFNAFAYVGHRIKNFSILYGIYTSQTLASGVFTQFQAYNHFASLYLGGEQIGAAYGFSFLKETITLSASINSYADSSSVNYDPSALHGGLFPETYTYDLSKSLTVSLNPLAHIPEEAPVLLNILYEYNMSDKQNYHGYGILASFYFGKQD